MYHWIHSYRTKNEVFANLSRVQLILIKSEANALNNYTVTVIAGWPHTYICNTQLRGNS